MKLKWPLFFAVLCCAGLYLGSWLGGAMPDRELPPLSYESHQPAPPPAPKTVDFSLSGNAAAGGEWLVLTATGNVPPVELTVSPTFADELVWYPRGESWVALLPISVDAKSELVQVTAAGGASTEDFFVQIRESDFPQQELTVDEATAADTLESDAAIDELHTAQDTIYSSGEPTALWEGAFLQPVEIGWISTEFGTTRVVNGRPPVRHNGIDFASPWGTPVHAANRGKVVFSGFLQYTGNTVCIDHGMGLRSWYYHLYSLDVAAEELVEKGQQIATVGTTGFSTGYHLHFTTTMERTAVNPWRLIEAAPDFTLPRPLVSENPA